MSLIVAGATGYGVWPANTLEGAAACLDAGLDGIEIDVQLTADGHVVAHHDYWPNRHATRLDGEWLGSRGPAIKALTLAELRRYDVGALRPGSSHAERYPARVAMDGVRIPTLPQILDRVIEDMKKNGSAQLVRERTAAKTSGPRQQPEAAA